MFAAKANLSTTKNVMGSLVNLNSVQLTDTDLDGTWIRIRVRFTTTFEEVITEPFEVNFSRPPEPDTERGKCGVGSIMPRIYGAREDISYSPSMHQSTSYNAMSVDAELGIIITAGVTGFDPVEFDSGKVFNTQGQPISFKEGHSSSYTVGLIHVYPLKSGTYSQAKYFMLDFGTSATI